MTSNKIQPAEPSVSIAVAKPRARKDPLSGRVTEPKTLVKPVASAIRILQILGQDGTAATTTQLGKQLGINTSTCFNILRTLTSTGVVDFDPETKTYSTGLGLVRLVSNVALEEHVTYTLQSFMHEFAEEHGVTMTLWRRLGNDRIVLTSVEHNSGNLRIHMRSGQRFPLFLGATGRLMVTEADLPMDELRAQFETLRWARPISFEDYYDQSMKAGERGWALDDGNFSAGISSIAAPILDPAGKIRSSVVAVMFRGQYDMATMERIGEDLVKLGSRFSDLLYPVGKRL